MAAAPEAQRPNTTLWIAVVLAIAVLAFLGWRQFGSRPGATVPASSPAPAPAPAATPAGNTGAQPEQAPPPRRGDILVG